MTNDRDALDDWLTRDAHADDIVPSSGFAERVMTAVRESREAPPPIPFPWLRVVPWFAIAIGLVALASVQMTWASPATSSEFDLPAAWQTAAQAAASPDMAWLVLGILLSVLTMTSALRAGAPRRPM